MEKLAKFLNLLAYVVGYTTVSVGSGGAIALWFIWAFGAR